MIINEVEGNLVEAFLNPKDLRINSMAHGANCFHTMGSGIAGEIARKIPEAIYADKQTSYGCANKLGFGSVAVIDRAHREDQTLSLIMNLYTQYNPGPDARIAAVASCIRKLNSCNAAGRIVGIPLIGCGIGGLQWEEVKEVINTNAPDIDIVVFHFKP